MRDVTVVEVHALVLVLHAQVSSDCGVGHDLLILLLVRILNMVAIEHGIWGDVLERWLQLSLHHDVLLHELYLAAFFALLLRYLLYFVERDGVVAVVDLVVELKRRLSL